MLKYLAQSTPADCTEDSAWMCGSNEFRRWMHTFISTSTFVPFAIFFIALMSINLSFTAGGRMTTAPILWCGAICIAWGEAWFDGPNVGIRAALDFALEPMLFSMGLVFLARELKSYDGEPFEQFWTYIVCGLAVSCAFVWSIVLNE